MVERHLVVKRLEVIEDCLDRAKRLARRPRASFENNPDVYMLAERSLHLALEALLDIANHVISNHGLGSAESYSDAIERLASGKVISRALCKKLIPWVGFRNLLVHGYIKLDHGKTYDAIKKDLAPIRQFVKAVSTLL